MKKLSESMSDALKILQGAGIVQKSAVSAPKASAPTPSVGAVPCEECGAPSNLGQCSIKHPEVRSLCRDCADRLYLEGLSPKDRALLRNL